MTKHLAAVAAVLVASACRSTCTNPPAPPAQPAEARKVAVLISTEYAETMTNIYDADAWYDLAHTYCMLRRNGFTDDNIWVLYAYGKDGFYRRRWFCSKPKSIGFPSPTSPEETYYQRPYCVGLEYPQGHPLSEDLAITDLPMVSGKRSDTDKNGDLWLDRFFECLGKGCDPNVVFGFECGTRPYIHKLTDQDTLFVWWRGHGYPEETDVGHRSTKFTLTGRTEISSKKLVEWVGSTGAGRAILSVESCHSGCMQDMMSSIENHAILLTSSSCLEESNNSYQPDVYHGVWSYWLAGSLQGWLPNGVPNSVQGPTGLVQIPLAVGGPIDVSFSSSCDATTTLFADQNPEKIDKANLAGKTKMSRRNPMNQTQTQ